MPNETERLADLATIRQIDLQRVATWMLRQIAEDLKTLEDDIVAEILSADPTGPTKLHAQQARLQTLLLSIQAEIRKVLREIEDRIVTTFDDVIEATAEKERDDLLAIYTLTTIVDTASLPKAEALLVDGATIGQWRKRISEETMFRVRNRIQDGVSAGLKASGIADSVKGDTRLKKSDGEIAKTEKALEMVVRTGVDSVANETTVAVGAEIPEETESIFGPHGWQQLSVLDNRTTEICKAYAYKIWDASFEPVGHKLPYNAGPPRHIYCRSRVIFIFLDDPVKPQSFKEWLGKKSATEQDKIFGEKKMALWKKGTLTDLELIRQTDRQMTLDQYREKS